MSDQRTLVLVCQNVDCKSRGGEEIMQRLQERLGGDTRFDVRPYMCFGTCHLAPNVVIYPQRQFYSLVQLGDVDELVEALQQGTRVERICDKADEGAREFMYNLLDAGIY